MPQVYSYVRFSSEIQSKGDSLRRQKELSEKYCRDNGLTLNTDFNLKDLGISAFKGNNASSGDLGRFINAVESGVVKSGSTLLVESLDRLSRQSPLIALNQFTNLLNAGITIITLIDNHKYSADNINDIQNLLVSILLMSRAYEESATKSKRISAAWERKYELARTELKPIGRCCPGWIELIDGKYQIKVGTAETINKIFELYIAGYGYGKIIKILTDNNYPVFGCFTSRIPKRWYIGTVNKLLDNPSVIGEFQGISNYFPVVVQPSVYHQAKAIREGKSSGLGGRKGKIFNIFAHLCKCGLCGGAMIKINKPLKSTGEIQGWMSCDKGRKGLSGCGAKGWKLDDLEPELLKAITEVNISELFGNNDNGLKLLSSEIISVEYKIAENTKQKDNVINTIVNMGGNNTLEGKLKELELITDNLNNQLKLLKADYSTESNKHNLAKQSQDNILILKDKLSDNENRLKLNQEIRKIVSKIVLFNTSRKFTIMYKNQVVKFGREDGLLEMPRKSRIELPDIDDLTDLDYQPLV